MEAPQSRSSEPEKQPDANQKQPGESPFYEYTASSSESSTSTQGQQGDETQSEQGFVYPPPPSYYQNLQLPAERPPLPPVPPLPGQAQTAAQQPQPVQPALRYQPGNYPPQWRPPARRSRKQTWIIISIIGASVLLLCGAGSWALYNIMGSVFQQVSGAPQVVQDFYQQVQSQNYSAAFNDLHISGQTSQDFLQQAQALDIRYGPVKSFQVGATSIASGTSSAWQITVNVTRANAAYAVVISVDNASGAWKITDLDLTKF